jgi:hypothetical protein
VQDAAADSQQDEEGSESDSDDEELDEDTQALIIKFGKDAWEGFDEGNWGAWGEGYDGSVGEGGDICCVVVAGSSTQQRSGVTGCTETAVGRRLVLGRCFSTARCAARTTMFGRAEQSCSDAPAAATAVTSVCCRQPTTHTNAGGAAAAGRGCCWVGLLGVLP